MKPLKHMFSKLGLLCLGLIFPVSVSQAITFNVTYDSSVTSLTNATQVETAFGFATHTLQILYTNPITINITVYWGSTGPFTNGIGLGSSYSQLVGNPSSFKYASVTNALRSARTTLNDSNAVASLPATDPTGGTYAWYVPRAEAKALTLTSLGVGVNDSSNDGAVGFATNMTYTFDATNRAVAGAYDFIAVAEHEITEVMGRTYILDYGLAGYEPYDLFRFTNSGGRSFGIFDTNVYFSVDKGVTHLNDFYEDVYTGDLQDWAGSSPADACDAYITDGFKATLSDSDLVAVDILGYNLNFSMSRPAGVVTNGSTFQITFTNAPGLDFTILATTNLAATSWINLGPPTENPAGHYFYNDSSTNKYLFYRLRLN